MNEIRQAISSQLGFLGRNLRTIERLLDERGERCFPLPFKEQRRYWVIQEVYRQQEQMYHIGWDAFNEGGDLPAQIQNYRERFGFYPEVVIADTIYRNKANRAYGAFVARERRWGVPPLIPLSISTKRSS